MPPAPSSRPARGPALPPNTYLPPVTDTARIPRASLVMLAAAMITFFATLTVITFQAAWYWWIIPAVGAAVFLVLFARWRRQRAAARRTADR